MIVLKKGSHYTHTEVPEDAYKMMQDGYELIKGASVLAKMKKQQKPKKKLFKKKK
tara:strand:- start:57 stop:221 length:165 start_codon:yes stop_codon:yes gene_type:complete